MGPRQQRIVLGVGLSLFATLFSLVLVEAVFRLVVPPEQFLEHRSQLYWKVRLRHSIERKKKRSADIQYDPALGWRMKPYFVKDGIHHNSRGFRGRNEYGPRANRRRVLVIGASMAYGLGISDSKIFSSLLEATTKAEIINAGVTGYGADQALLMWEREGMALKPDLVVLVYDVDDYYRNGLWVRDDGAKPRFVRVNDTFRLAGVPVPDREGLLASGALASPSRLRLTEAMSWLARQLRGQPGVSDRRQTARLDGLNQYILTRLRDSVRGAGGELLVVLAGAWSDGSYPSSERSIAVATRVLGIPFVNMIDRMPKNDLGSYYATNHHWSERGHALVATVLEQQPELRR